MTVDLPAAHLLGFLLALARSAAWVSVAPPFNVRSIPVVVKAGIAAALSLPVAAAIPPHEVPQDVGPLVADVAVQAVAGAALGFLTLLLFSAVQAAGELLDVFGGFTIAAAYDPLGETQSAIFGRLHQLLALTLLFAIGGHLLVVRGFLASYDALPVTAALDLHTLARTATTGVGLFFVAALQIAAPLVAALFLADVGLALLSRAAPQLNVFSLAFPLKILLTLLLAGLAFTVLPDAVTALVERALHAIAAVSQGRG